MMVLVMAVIGVMLAVSVMLAGPVTDAQRRMRSAHRQVQAVGRTFRLLMIVALAVAAVAVSR